MDRAYLTGTYTNKLRNECLRDYESLGRTPEEVAKWKTGMGDGGQWIFLNTRNVIIPVGYAYVSVS